MSYTQATRDSLQGVLGWHILWFRNIALTEFLFFVFLIFRGSVNNSYTHATLGGRRAPLGRLLSCGLNLATG